MPAEREERCVVMCSRRRMGVGPTASTCPQPIGLYRSTRPCGRRAIVEDLEQRRFIVPLPDLVERLALAGRARAASWSRPCAPGSARADIEVDIGCGNTSSNPSSDTSSRPETSASSSCVASTRSKVSGRNHGDGTGAGKDQVGARAGVKIVRPGRADPGPATMASPTLSDAVSTSPSPRP